MLRFVWSWILCLEPVGNDAGGKNRTSAAALWCDTGDLDGGVVYDGVSGI